MTEREGNKGGWDRRPRAKAKASAAKRGVGAPELPRRVLMTTDALSGAWGQSLELARTLSIFGVSTVLAILGPAPSAEDVIAAQEIPGLVLVEANFRLEWMPDAGEDIERAGSWLLDLEAEFAPDIVHLHGFAHAVLPWRAPSLISIQGCLGTWWPNRSQGSLFSWSAYPAIVERALRAADAVVTSTGSGMARLQHQYGPLANGRIIPIGRNPGDYAETSQENEVIATGMRRWEDVTNIAALDAIAPSLPWPVINANAPGTEATDPAHAAGGLTRLSSQRCRSMLSRAAIFALPARAEPLDSLVLEAAYSGCALVLGDIPALREIWNGAAVFVPPEDGQALADELKHLIEDPPRRRVLSRLASRRARKYTAVNMTKRYLTAYSEMLDRGGNETLDRPRVRAVAADA